jgi:ribosomal protein S27AE
MLEENDILVAAILENQNLGRFEACVKCVGFFVAEHPNLRANCANCGCISLFSDRFQFKLQQNLLSLAKLADSQLNSDLNLQTVRLVHCTHF